MTNKSKEHLISQTQRGQIAREVKQIVRETLEEVSIEDVRMGLKFHVADVVEEAIRGKRDELEKLLTKEIPTDGTLAYCSICNNYVKAGEVRKYTLVHPQPVGTINDKRESELIFLCSKCAERMESQGRIEMVLYPAPVIRAEHQREQ